MSEVVAQLVVQGGALGVLALVLYFGIRAIRDVFSRMAENISELTKAINKHESNSVRRHYELKEHVRDVLDDGPRTLPLVAAKGQDAE